MTDTPIVYLDYAATTPVDPRVLAWMTPYMRDTWHNPNSLYASAREAHAALEDARERFATCIGAKHPNEVVFTSGGTESDNAAVLGIASRRAPQGGHVVVSAFEHHAVLEPAHVLEGRGYRVTRLRPDASGIVRPESLQDVMESDTVLVSVMHGNNELGTLQPLAELTHVAHTHGAAMHTDAAQTFGKAALDVAEIGVDAVSFSGHKIYGPKGTGALYLRRGTAFEPLLVGGGQEFKKRSGTQNVAGAQGLARAAELMVDEMDSEIPRLRGLRDRVWEGLLARIPGARRTVETDRLLPNIAATLIPGAEGEAMLVQLDVKGIALSAGSACSSGSHEPSHVLTAIGCPRDMADGSLRISVGRFTNADDIEYLLETLPPIVERIRAMNPSYRDSRAG